jgi:hypothetical protein
MDAPPSTNAWPHFGQFTFDPAARPADFIVPWQCGQAIFGDELAVDMNARFLRPSFYNRQPAISILLFADGSDSFDLTVQRQGAKQRRAAKSQNLLVLPLCAFTSFVSVLKRSVRRAFQSTMGFGYNQEDVQNAQFPPPIPRPSRRRPGGNCPGVAA